MVRLYYTEPWLRGFDAVVARVADDARGQRVWLDRTAFYPTSGGQPFDTGTMNDARVVEVSDDEDGEVVHVIEGEALTAGSAVRARIDWARRFDHMQQHTGQHLLSAAFERIHGVRTESFRLGNEFSTIDLAREVSPQEIAAAELDANRVVWEGRPITIRFVSDEEAARLPLRKEPARTGRLRLIEIDAYDLSACGGTHVSTTGEVGLIAVRTSERFKGGTRLEFVCGGRALTSYHAWRDAASQAARQLSVLPADLPSAIERLQEDGKETRRAMKALSEKAATLEAATLGARATPAGALAVLADALEGYDAAALKRLAASFVREPSRAIVLFTATAPVQVVALRSADALHVDCARIVTSLTQRFGGRGGGKPEGAQGGGLAGDVRAMVDEARALLSNQPGD